jgi:hypothetical protein
MATGSYYLLAHCPCAVCQWPRKWPPLSLFLPALLGGGKGGSSESKSGDDTARRWGLAFEASADGAGAVEVAWSKAPGVMAGDVVRAVDGQAVRGIAAGQDAVAAVEKLLLLHDGATGGGVRLTLDTTKGWGISSGARRQQRLEDGWCRFAYHWLLDGYERLLDARCCPHRKLALHALALVLLLPLIESAFQSCSILSKQHGPLVLLDHDHLLLFERAWSLLFLLVATGLGTAFTLFSRPRLGASLVGGGGCLLHCLLLALLVIPAVAGLTLLTSGFVLPPPPPLGLGLAATVGATDDALFQKADAAAAAAGEGDGRDQESAAAALVLEDELSALLAHVLCALLLPLFASAYLRRVARFCDAYAALLHSGRNPKRLRLAMPLSAHFVAPAAEERARFLALRASGY